LLFRFRRRGADLARNRASAGAFAVRCNDAGKDRILPERSKLIAQQAPKPPSPPPAPGPDILPPDPPPQPAKPDIPAPDPAPLPQRNPGDNPLPPVTDPDIPGEGDPQHPPLRVAARHRPIEIRI
jgi:hypothetical protein